MLVFKSEVENSADRRAMLHRRFNWTPLFGIIFTRKLAEALPQASVDHAMRSRLSALASAASAVLAASIRLWSDLMVSVFAFAVWSATSRISAWLTTIWAGYVGPMALMRSTCCTSYFAGIRSGFLKRLG